MDNMYFVNKGSRAYTPKGVRNEFEQAVMLEDGDIAKVLNNKHKYKALLELWHASLLALAINKWLNKKYLLYPADNPLDPGPPDVLFLNEVDGEAFPVEVTELHTSADDVWRAKGKVNFDKCHLLIVSRKNDLRFNVSNFARKIQKYDWHFERIWLALYTINGNIWTFFDIFPPAQSANVPNIQFSTENQADMIFWY